MDSEDEWETSRSFIFSGLQCSWDSEQLPCSLLVFLLTGHSFIS